MDDILHWDIIQRQNIEQTQGNIEEIPSGNINFLYRISYGKKTVVAKVAKPYIKILGTTGALTTQRLAVEISALTFLAQHLPDIAPSLLDYSLDDNVYLMTDLSDYDLLSSLRIVEYPQLARLFAQLAKFHSLSYQKTHLLPDSSVLDNHAMCHLSEEYIFTFPFIDHPSNKVKLQDTQNIIESIRLNPRVRQKVDEALSIFKHKKHALIHGDLHFGSIFKRGNDFKLIDWEFAFIGPLSFDLGIVFANYFIQCFIHYKHSADTKVFTGLTQAFDHYYESLEQNIDYALLLNETVCFMAIEIFRRIVGPASFIELNDAIADNLPHDNIEQELLQLTQIALTDNAANLSFTTLTNGIKSTL